MNSAMTTEQRQAYRELVRAVRRVNSSTSRCHLPAAFSGEQRQARGYTSTSFKARSLWRLLAEAN